MTAANALMSFTEGQMNAGCGAADAETPALELASPDPLLVVDVQPATVASSATAASAIVARPVLRSIAASVRCALAGPALEDNSTFRAAKIGVDRTFRALLSSQGLRVRGENAQNRVAGPERERTTGGFVRPAVVHLGEKVPRHVAGDVSIGIDQ